MDITQLDAWRAARPMPCTMPRRLDAQKPGWLESGGQGPTLRAPARACVPVSMRGV